MATSSRATITKPSTQETTSSLWEGQDIVDQECSICLSGIVTHVHGKCGGMICFCCLSSLHTATCPFCRFAFGKTDWLLMQKSGEEKWTIDTPQHKMQIGENVPKDVPQIMQWGSHCVDVHEVNYKASTFWLSKAFLEDEDSFFLWLQAQEKTNNKS